MANTYTAESPSITPVARSSEVVTVTDVNGTDYDITFRYGVPAAISGIGSLSDIYDRRLSPAEVNLLQEAAANQRLSSGDPPLPKNASLGARTGAVRVLSASDGKATVAANITTQEARDTSFGIYTVPEYNKNGNTQTYPSYEIDAPEKELVYSDYSDIYSRGKGGTREKIIQSIGLIEATSHEYLLRASKKYNRFKLPVLDTYLQRTFAHVFFVKPSCSIQLSENGLTSQSKTPVNDANFSYMYQHSPELISELTQQSSNNETHFSFVLSNAAQSFSLTDEFIETDSYGKSYLGYDVAFGRHDAPSKTSGEFTISFQDDRDMSIYRLIKLWVSYIAGTYRGLYAPTDYSIENNIMDYGGAVYYILTAEDGETILFWSKYYGVFPTTVPSTQYSWSYGSILHAPTLEIPFKYSFKEDFNVDAITEFNFNAGLAPGSVSNLRYEKTYNEELGTVGKTWTGSPFIETEVVNGITYFKLRFKQVSD